MLGPGVAAARATQALSRVARRGGTTLPGRVLLRMEPKAIDRLGERLAGGSVLVSATNGKTTTASMLSSALERAGRDLVHNRAGSNMNWGIATALLEADAGRDQLGLFEVDEFWLPEMARALDPQLFLLSNLFRDQLDRYGELDLIADRWAAVVAERAGRSRFVLNADDPLVADLGREREGVVYFGVEDDSHSLPELEHASDSKRCRNCGHEYVYDAVYLAHMGRYHCPHCGRRRPDPSIAATRIELDGMRGSRVHVRTPQAAIELDLPLPGLYNVYNAL
ncbi:MAG TPA: Mur ligase family protein, partial [Thermoleophilaceae bacterium]